MERLLKRIRDLRHQVVSARINLQMARDELETARARAEARVTEAAGGDKGLGSNTETRQRALTLALACDDEYQHALKNVRDMEADCLAVEADLEDAKDERRAEEWRIRAALAEALDRSGVQTDHHDATDDNAFDDATDQRVLRKAVEVAMAAGEKVEPEFNDDLPF